MFKLKAGKDFVFSSFFGSNQAFQNQKLKQKRTQKRVLNLQFYIADLPENYPKLVIFLLPDLRDRP